MTTRYSRASRSPLQREYEAAVIPGLEPFAEKEIAALPGTIVNSSPREGRLTVRYDGPLAEFKGLNSVTAVHLVHHIEASRPTALLGHQNFTEVTGLARLILSSHPRGVFQTLRLSAAGSESKPLIKFQTEVASALGLQVTNEPAHLELALRRAQAATGWELLLRLTPKPLSARGWRVCDFPGALNATVAWVMAGLTNPHSHDVFINACCGSGTLLVERLRYGPLEAGLGFDIGEGALACARRNVGSRPDVQLTMADARELPLPDDSVSNLVTDPPFAMLQGSGGSNRELYPGIFREAARVLKPRGIFAIISTQNRLVREVASDERHNWKPSQTVSLKMPFQGGYITPTIYTFERLAR